MEENRWSAYNCFNCGRDLGPQQEWKKIDTERGPICYVCYNEAMGNSPREAKEMDEQFPNRASRDTTE